MTLYIFIHKIFGFVYFLAVVWEETHRNCIGCLFGIRQPQLAVPFWKISKFKFHSLVCFLSSYFVTEKQWNKSKKKAVDNFLYWMKLNRFPPLIIAPCDRTLYHFILWIKLFLLYKSWQYFTHSRTLDSVHVLVRKLRGIFCAPSKIEKWENSFMDFLTEGGLVMEQYLTLSGHLRSV